MAAGAHSSLNLRKRNEREPQAFSSQPGGRFFLAASFNLLLKGYGWRVMFVIGVLPAFVSLLSGH